MSGSDHLQSLLQVARPQEFPGFWGAAEGHCHCPGSVQKTKRRERLDNQHRAKITPMLWR